MFHSIFHFAFLSFIAGSVFPHSLPLPHEKPPEWERPVVISEGFFPPHPPPPHDFKEIIGIELQRIPLHGGPARDHEILEHERHKEHEILEHERQRKHELLEHKHREEEFLEHKFPHEILEPREHEIIPHHGVLEHKHHHEIPHGIPEFEHREHEFFPHEIMEHKHRDHEIMDREHHHEMHHEPWEDPEFFFGEEVHHHEHEMHHDELFPEGSRRRTGNRRQNEGGSRRGGSNSNRRENNNRRNNSSGGGQRRNREGGSGINTEELFPRRNNNRRNNSNNNNRSNNNNNRRQNNNREGSRRNSNIEELAAIEAEILETPEEMSEKANSRPERQAGTYVSEGWESTAYETSQQPSVVQEYNSGNTNTFSSQQSPITEDKIVNTFVSGSESRPGRVESIYTDSRTERPSFSSNQGYQSSFGSSGTSYSSQNSRPEHTSGNIFIKEDEYLTLDHSKPKRPSSSFGSSQGQQGSSRPSEYGSFGANRPEEGLKPGSGRDPGYLGSRPNSGKPVLPDTSVGSRPSSGFFSQEERRPGGVLQQGERPSGGFFSEQERPNRPSSGLFSNQEERPSRPSSGFVSGQEERPKRPGSERERPHSGSSGLYSNQEERPNRPSGSSGLYSNQEERPNRPSGSSGLYSNQEERPKRPAGSSGLYSNQEERPNRPSSGFISSQEERPKRPGSGHKEERPYRPSSGSSGLYSNQEERPYRPGQQERPSGSSGHFTSQEERPNRPGSHSHNEERPNRPSGSSGHYSSQERPNRPSSGKPNRPGSSSSYTQEERPHQHGSNHHGSKPNSLSASHNEEESRPRPSNGNNPNKSDLISVQEDPWLWPTPSEEEDKQNRRTSHSGGNKKPSKTQGSNKKQHANLKLLPTESCGIDLGNKIIGGTNAQLDEFPWMALLQHSSEGRALGFGCGGSLISPRYVLTAAHCIKGPAISNNVRVTKVRLGEFDTSSETDCQGEICSPPPVDVAVEEIIVHPNYKATDKAQLHDIALIRLRENVKTSAYVSPICLPINGKSKDYIGEKLTVAGWGKTSNGQTGASSKTKQKVSIPVVSLEDCSPFYNRLNINLKDTQMCAGGEKGKDSCQGDSGGPLMGSEVIDGQVRWQVHGVVSFGPEDCGIDNVAGVYTKVSEYIDWILDNMKR